VLGDLANHEVLYELQSKILAGVGSRFNRRRSKATVRGYMGSVVASLNWAHRQGWLKAAIQIERISTDDHMKGRPLDDAEFASMLEAARSVVGIDGAPSWQFMLQGVVNSGLRLTELMTISWDVP